MNKKNTKFLSTIFAILFISAFNLNAQESELSQNELLEIEATFKGMSSLALNEKQASLIAEAEELKGELLVSQSPANRKSISARLDRIFAELSVLQTIFGTLASAALLDNLVLKDDYKDSTAPVITVTGANPATVELGASYTDAGASADTGEAVVTSGSVNTSSVGAYTLTYTATDDWGNIGTATRTVNVVDTTAPVMTVLGDNPATVELGASYTDAGASGSDLGGTVSVTSSGSVNSDSVGAYTITYTGTDPSGNSSSATRTVNVVDTTAPVITVAGSDPVTIELGTTYTDAGATASDLSGSITVTTNGTVDADTVGSYTLTYVATDASGNTTTATRTVNVTDTTLPVVSVTGDNPATHELGSTYTDAGATATDASGTVTVVTTGTVDADTLGTYTLTYTSTDASGNAGTATRTVNVTDTTAPVVVVTGSTSLTSELGFGYTDAGATATDINTRNDATGATGAVTVVTTGSVDTNTVGTYTLTYTATDASGNAGTATRTVTVSDTIAPVLTVTGSASVTSEKGFTYTDLGATAVDLNERNDLTGNDGSITVVTSGTVNTNAVGTYTLTYTATDQGGNTDTGTRTVNIVDTLAPIFTSSASFTADENQTAIGTVSAYDINTRNDLTGNLGTSNVTFSMTDLEMVITSAGVLSFRNAPDFEDNKSNTFTGVVTATDDESNSSSQTITVTINDVGGFDDNPDTGTETSTVTDVVVEVETEVVVGTGTGTATVTTTATGTTTGT